MKKNIYEKPIVLFTSNNKGGILQFTLRLYEMLKSKGYKVIVYIPKSHKKNFIIDNGCFFYKKSKKANFLKLAKGILKNSPRYILFCDNSIPSLLTLKKINEFKSIGLIIHDVIPHYERFSVYKELKKILESYLTKKVMSKVDDILLLSKNSFNKFCELYPKHQKKAILFNLFPHVPKVISPKKPIEMKNLDKDYYLFFGRIAKYKGLKLLFKAFNSINNNNNKLYLVVAGEGKMSLTEKKLYSKSENIILINRYIEDEEMHYLFLNSRVVVLPYLEASQSGVLSIAYYFGKPVIVSNLPGLIEYVEENKTGLVFKNEEELKNSLLKINDDDFYNSMIPYIKEFTSKLFDEEKIVNDLIFKLKI